MRTSVYIETTIPSYYYDQRESLRVHIDRTRIWWDEESHYYDLYTSPVVYRELSEGNHPFKSDVLQLIDGLASLSYNSDIERIVDVYVSKYLMPSSDTRDAFHLAFASYYKIDFLLTWNCAHLANVNKRQHITHVNTSLGLWNPIITTPLELLPKESGWK